jgi:choline dehydrogenase-like flavoprotein
VTLRLRPEVVVDGHSWVTGVRLQRDDVQVLALNHLGPAAPGHAMLLVVALAPTGIGRVDPGPVVHHEVSAHDHGRLAVGLDLVRALLAHPAFADVVEDVQVGAAPAGVYHPTSTCRIGPVVDDDGLVHGLDNVHVVDASVFPDIPRTNTYLPTLLLAEHLAPRLATRG